MDLEALIQDVHDQAQTDAPLDLLSVAVTHHGDLTEQADQLLDHFIHTARDDGCSWAQIGDVLGVSKQAAQQRHGDVGGLLSRFFGGQGRGTGRGLFRRFTDRARNAVVEAQNEARGLNHNYIGTEHVLLGLLLDDESVATKVLQGFSISRDEVVAEIEARIGRGEDPVKRGHIPFTPLAKKSLEGALKSARELDHTYIGTEHILLGVLSVDDGVGAQILHDRGVTRANARKAIIDHLTN